MIHTARQKDAGVHRYEHSHHTRRETSESPRNIASGERSSLEQEVYSEAQISHMLLSSLVKLSFWEVLTHMYLYVSQCIVHA